MNKKSIDDIEVSGLRVLVRVDLNVPLDGDRITDDRRITAALPTIQSLRDRGAKVILMSHLGRPEGSPSDRSRYSLAPVAKRLSELLEIDVPLADDCTGESATQLCEKLAPGDAMLLENLRFRDEETIKGKHFGERPELREQKEAFARSLASLADVYVNDAFGTCHRDNASMYTVPLVMEGQPRVVGYLVQRELEFLGKALTDPKRPFVCLLGGAKVSDKLGVIRSLLERCDTILVGGAMAYTFLKAKGEETGWSLVEPDLVETAKQLLADAGERIQLPVDSVIAHELAKDAKAEVCSGGIPREMMGLDIGPETVKRYAELIAKAGTIVWNGPMGVFETPPFDKGTFAMADAVASATDAGAISIIGGGDSAAAVQSAGLADRISHVSTGGGASLEFLEGKTFAALDVLDDA